MAKKAKVVNPKKEDTLPAKAEPRELGKPVSIQAVGLIDQGTPIESIEGLPADMRQAETLAGFPPSPEWRKPGEALFGDFIGVRTDVGPNHSRLYEIAAYQGEDKDPLTVAVWGSAALDRLFDSAYPPIQTGDKMGIIFLGEKDTKRGLNPVKLFALKVKRANGRVSTQKAE